MAIVIETMNTKFAFCTIVAARLLHRRHCPFSLKYLQPATVRTAPSCQRQSEEVCIPSTALGAVSGLVAGSTL
jgi:hypothetical protein